MNDIVLSSSWKEIILISLSFVVFLGGKIEIINKVTFKILIVSILFVLLGTLSSLFITHSSLSESILIGKRYIFPFLFLCSLSLIPDTEIDIKKSCNVFFYMIIMPNFLFGLWELFTVKTLNDLWFYDALVSAGNNFESFNHFRDGIVRSNGFFVGTLTYAATAFCSCVFFFILRKERFSYFKMLISFSMLLFSQTRTFFIGLFFFLLLYVVSTFIFKKKIKPLSVIIFILTCFLSILLLLPFVTQEFSAIGRIYQWSNALDLVFNYPLGQGFSSIGASGDNRADSQIIDLIRIYGFFVVPLCFTFISLIILYWNKSRLFTQANYAELPFLAILSFLFILFFQSLVDVAILYFMLLLFFKSRLNKRVNYA
ncbi:hypothetical protein Q4568_08090 [Photobacterium sanguinicancri]|uniref:O-antigen polymerase n=2 Tax=Photobacterium sanguinicancri TaxID=875932 RepID=A0AAW7Y4U8_9GAMM|nr:hypothetical protein [Photobacterium sanguinicancri]